MRAIDIYVVWELIEKIGILESTIMYCEKSMLYLEKKYEESERAYLKTKYCHMDD